MNVFDVAIGAGGVPGRGEFGLSWAKPGRKNIKGETLCTVEMPAHPAPTNTKTAPRAKHLKLERSFTKTILS